MSTSKSRLKRLVDAILAEADKNPDFAQSLEEALGSGDKPKKGNRRTAAAIDPFAVFESEGVDGLTIALKLLTLDQLRDVVSQYGMDPSKLVMKWKTTERVVAHIVERVQERSAKGDAFRS